MYIVYVVPWSYTSVSASVSLCLRSPVVVVVLAWTSLIKVQWESSSLGARSAGRYHQYKASSRQSICRMRLGKCIKLTLRRLSAAFLLELLRLHPRMLWQLLGRYCRVVEAGFCLDELDVDGRVCRHWLMEEGEEGEKQLEDESTPHSPAPPRLRARTLMGQTTDEPQRQRMMPSAMPCIPKHMPSASQCNYLMISNVVNAMLNGLLTAAASRGLTGILVSITNLT